MSDFLTEFDINTLPHLPHKHVARKMAMIDLISYSITSNYSKSIVKSLNIIATKLHLVIGSSETKLSVYFDNDFSVGLIFSSCFEAQLVRLEVDNTRETIHLDNSEINVRNGIYHLLNVFHCKFLEVQFKTEIPPEHIQEVFHGINIERIDIFDEAARQYLQILNACGTVNKAVIRIIGILHDGGIYVTEETKYSMKMVPIFKLEDDPNCNDLRLDLYGNASENRLNVFLKSWINRPNRKLKAIRGDFFAWNVDDCVEETFDGIHCVPTKSVFPPEVSVRMGITKGYDIQSEHGTKITVFFSLDTGSLDEQKCLEGDVFFYFHE